MHALHNRLFEMYEAATHPHLKEGYARQNVKELARLLALWSGAMEAALNDDRDRTSTLLRQALQHADKADSRKGVPKSRAQCVVKAQDLLGVT